MGTLGRARFRVRSEATAVPRRGLIAFEVLVGVPMRPLGLIRGPGAPTRGPARVVHGALDRAYHQLAPLCRRGRSARRLRRDFGRGGDCEVAGGAVKNVVAHLPVKRDREGACQGWRRVWR